MSGDQKMDNFIFCKTCHTANDSENDFCTACGCDLIDNLYFDSTNNTNLKNMVKFERKTGEDNKAEFKLNGADETLYTIKPVPSGRPATILLIILVPTILIALVIISDSYKLNLTITTIIAFFVFGFIGISFQSMMSIKMLVESSKKETIGKITLKNLLRKKNWKYTDVNNT